MRSLRVSVPSNGVISRVFGVFKTLCCDCEMVISVGAQFPDCPNHKNLSTEWKHLRDVDPTAPERAGGFK
jgi:hypothetical protein